MMQLSDDIQEWLASETMTRAVFEGMTRSQQLVVVLAWEHGAMGALDAIEQRMNALPVV